MWRSSLVLGVEISSATWSGSDWDWESRPRGADVILVFGDRHALDGPDWLEELRRTDPEALVFGGSSAGEIRSTRVSDGTIVATAVTFAHATAAIRCVPVDERSSRQSGHRLAATLPRPGLRHVFVLSDGLGVDGTELTRGLNEGLAPGVAVTGGLSGDAARFGATTVVADAPARSGVVAALGLYGDALRVGFGSLGGWDPFGPERLITRSSGTVLHDLDDRNALELYREYLGAHASDLPASALRFPLMLRGREGNAGLVRTVLAIDDDARTMRFAGEVPEGSYARLMRANFERLIDGAHGAAQLSLARQGDGEVELALLVSCVGRKLVLGQRIEEEIEVVREVLGPRSAIAGFYSYGEICPQSSRGGCELHNQTMTITTLREEG